MGGFYDKVIAGAAGVAHGTPKAAACCPWGEQEVALVLRASCGIREVGNLWPTGKEQQHTHTHTHTASVSNILASNSSRSRQICFESSIFGRLWWPAASQARQAVSHRFRGSRTMWTQSQREMFGSQMHFQILDSGF